MILKFIGKILGKYIGTYHDFGTSSFVTRSVPIMMVVLIRFRFSNG